MKIKAYSSLSDVQNDLRRLSKEFTKQSRVYHHSKSALACAKLEVTAGLKKEVQDRQFWKCFEFTKELQRFDTILSNIELCLYHQFGDGDDFKTTMRQLQALSSRLSQESGALKTTITELASAKVPRQFKKQMVGLQTRLKLPCESSAVEYQFFPANKGMYFVSYLSFANLKDKNGYTNPNLHIAVAKYYGDGESHLKVAVAREKKIPSEMSAVTAETLWASVLNGLTSKNVAVKDSV